MSALGELIIFGIYGILIIPIILTFIVFTKRKKKWSGFIYILISSIPLMLFSYSQYQNNRESELLYVGTYYLTDYYECKSCIIKLKEDNTYSVINNDHEIESGKWNYRSGGDYWIVDLGDYGQLGSGKFKYTKYKNGFSKD
ncbi:hypothetical protein [uncultured Psychroserpens sp.]|uniref:hypothetical protein n=1 Tax=uncultured Psychroserpens sp. TaxID=255436 RepID=UPI002610BB4D|nr:hypothetical protein [uncultured Psychroserpens sp.]